MDLSTTYLGMTLRTPLVPSASPLSESLDNIKRMEDAGASAIVLYSLFEEQLTQDRQELQYRLTHDTESFSEATSFFPQPTEFSWGPEEYLEHIRKAKAAVRIPIIASLNGNSVGGWTSYAREMESAGADALELNIYYIPTDAEHTSQDVERMYLDILRAVKSVVKVPLAVKLGPFFSNMAHMARQLDAAGADALVLFNRFYQPDIDLDALEIRPRVLLSTPQETRLPLTWIGILYGRIRADMAGTGGIHQAANVLKMLMVGARVTMLCSVLLQRGIDHIRTIEQGVREWMETHEYESVRQMQGSMSQLNCPDSTAFARAQYVNALHTYAPR
jgi:dihydroorotate dehydrogenase (fumarate)